MPPETSPPPRLDGAHDPRRIDSAVRAPLERRVSRAVWVHARGATDQGFAVEGEASVVLGGARLAEGVGTAYVRWNWNGTRLRVEVDRYGAYPVFYEIGEREIAVSTSLSRLLEIDRRRSLDFDALAVFLRVGFFVNDDTPVREIRALPPGAVLEWSAQGLNLQVPELPRHRPLAISRRDAIAEYQRLFAAAVRRCETVPGSRTVVPLSGGRDSRHILLELCAQGRKPDLCVSARHFPPRPDEDCVVAKEVCDFLGVPLDVVSQAASMFEAELRKNVATSYCADEHAWMLELAATLERHAPDYVFDGIAGDVLSAGLFVTPSMASAFRSGDAQAAAGAVLQARPTAQGFGGRALKEVGAWRLLSEVTRERAIEHLTRAVQPHLDAPNPVASFFFWNRTRREIALAPFALLGGGGAAVFAPYLDHRLFDFLSSLPLSLVEDHRFHSDTIAHAYPRASSLRYEDKGAPERDARAHYRRFARELALWDVFRRPSPLVRPGARMRLLAAALGSGAAAAGEHTGRMYCYLSQLGRASAWATQQSASA